MGKTDDEASSFSLRELVVEVRSDIKDMQKRLMRVEVGGAALAALAAWQVTGRPSAGIPAGAVAAWQTARHFLPIF